MAILSYNKAKEEGNPSMRIAIYSDWWKPDLVGGAEQSAYTMALALQRRYVAHRFQIFTYSSGFRRSETLDCKLIVRTVGNLCIRRRYHVSRVIKAFEKIRIQVDPISPRLLARAILKSQPDVLIIHNMDRVGTKLVRIVARSGVPIIRVFHDLGDSCINRKRFKRDSPCKKTCLPCRPKSFQHISVFSMYEASVTCSSYTKRKLKSLGFSGSEMLVGYPEIVQQAERIHAKNLGNPYSIGFVGRLVPEKGIETLIHAVSIVREKFELNVKLVIAGTGSDAYLSKIKKLSDNVEVATVFTGYLENPYDYLRNKIDLIVVPSLWEEPLGRVPLEAGSYGIPSLVSDIGGLVEARELLSDGVSFFKPGDPEDLAQKIFWCNQNRPVNKIELNAYRTMESAVSEILERYHD